MKTEEDKENIQMEKDLKITIETARNVEKKLLELIETSPENEASYRSMIDTVLELSGILEEVQEGLNYNQTMNGKKSDKGESRTNETVETPNEPIFVIESPLGNVAVDMKAYADAKAAAHALMPKLTRQNMFDSKMFTFLNVTKTQRDSRYWKGHLGALMKMHLDSYL